MLNKVGFMEERLISARMEPPEIYWQLKQQFEHEAALADVKPHVKRIRKRMMKRMMFL